MRGILLRFLLGANIAIFVNKIEPNSFQIKIGDTRKRKKLLDCKVAKVTSTQYRVNL